MINKENLIELQNDHHQIKSCRLRVRGEKRYLEITLCPLFEGVTRDEIRSKIENALIERFQENPRMTSCGVSKFTLRLGGV